MACEALVSPTHIIVECANLTGFACSLRILNIIVTTANMNYLPQGLKSVLCIIAHRISLSGTIQIIIKHDDEMGSR